MISSFYTHIEYNHPVESTHILPQVDEFEDHQHLLHGHLLIVYHVQTPYHHYILRWIPEEHSEYK